MGTPASGKSLEVVELRGFCYVMPNAFTEKNMFFLPILIFNTCFIE